MHDPCDCFYNNSSGREMGGFWYTCLLMKTACVSRRAQRKRKKESERTGQRKKPGQSAIMSVRDTKKPAWAKLLIPKMEVWVKS